MALLALAACSPSAPEKASATAPPTAQQQAIADADFGLRMALLEGHLMVGNALMLAGQKDNALPHFGHPVRELYSDMLPYIASHHGVQFDRDLIALEGLAAAQGNSAQYTTSFAAVMEKAHAARALIPAERFNSDDYTLALAADIATSASQEYRNAIIAGQVGSLVEYHDARGFIFYLSDLLANHHGSDPRLAQMASLTAELKHMVEPLNPPDPPRGTPEDFEARAASMRNILKPAAAATP